MRMIDDPIPFIKLVQKNLVGNYELIMGICGKIFIINLHNLQILFTLWIKNKFSECLAPLHKYEGPQWKTFWRRFCPCPQTRCGIRGKLPPNHFCTLPNFVVLRKICFKHKIKYKYFPLKMYISPPNLKTWLRAWFCQNCVCNQDILFWRSFGPEM